MLVCFINKRESCGIITIFVGMLLQGGSPWVTEKRCEEVCYVSRYVFSKNFLRTFDQNSFS